MAPINNEADLFDFLKRSEYPDLVKAKTQMSRWDCYSLDERHRIELKCRRKHYETLLIEKKKFDAIVKICEDNLDIPMYICSTPGGVFVFNLFWIEPDWEINRRNPATTEFANGSRVEKEVAYLSIEEAKRL